MLSVIVNDITLWMIKQRVCFRPPASSEFTNAADGQGSPQSQIPPATQTSDQHPTQDAKHQVQQQAQMQDIKLEGTSQQEVNHHADQLVKEYE